MDFMTRYPIFRILAANKLKVTTLGFFYTLSLFILLRSGVFFQYFTSALDQDNCYECSMKLDYIKQFYFSSDTLYYFIPSFCIFISSLFINKRIQGYLLILLVSWLSLSINDIVASFSFGMFTVSYILLNVIYNLLGAILISLFVCFSNSTIKHLNKNKGVSLLLAAIIPLIFSIIIAFAITIMVYLIYSRQPVNVELDLSDGTNIAYTGDKNDKESFGFLNDKITNTPTYIDIMSDGKISYQDNKGISSVSVYVFSGCYAIPELMKNIPLNKAKTIINTKSIELKSNFPMIGFIDGKSINVKPSGALQLSLKKGKESYTLGSRIKDSSIDFDTNNAQMKIAFTILPLKEDDYLDEYSYDFYINEKKYTIQNIIEPLSRLDNNKKMKCNYQQISADENIYHIKGKYLTGFVMVITPDDIIAFKNSPSLSLKARHAFFKKTYDNLDKIYDDISNGKLTSLNGDGVSQLLVNGKIQNIKPESKITITSGNLFGLVNKNKIIKIYGTADLIFVDNKMLNLRNISVLQSKLEIFDSSLSEIFKYIFSFGTLALCCKFIYSYFKNNINDNFFA